MNLLILVFIAIFSTISFACQIHVPTSEAVRYIEALEKTGQGVPPLYKCEDKPEEKCHCADEVIWEDAELITEFSQDELGINIESKKLVNSEAKKAANEAKKQVEKELELSNKAAKKALKLSIKDDIKTATTVAKLKAVIEKMIEAEE